MEDKELFVKELGKVLHRHCRQGIKNLQYILARNPVTGTQSEYVLITFNSGAAKNICVTGDSVVGITADVARALE